MKGLKLSIVFSVLLASGTKAGGELSIEGYLRYEKTNPKEVQAYLNGLLSGFGYSNVELVRRGQPRLYCQPDKLAITTENVKQLISEVIKNWDPDDLKHYEAVPGSLDYTALRGLTRSFPCNK